MLRFIKTYPLTILCVCAVWYLSMSRITPPPFRVFSWFDKCVHCIMYAGVSGLVWLEYGRSHRIARKDHIAVWAVLFPALMGGLVELAQAYLTTCRSGDWLDFLANIIGVVLASLVGAAVYAKLHKWKMPA